MVELRAAGSLPVDPIHKVFDVGARRAGVPIHETRPRPPRQALIRRWPLHFRQVGDHAAAVAARTLGVPICSGIAVRAQIDRLHERARLRRDRAPGGYGRGMIAYLAEVEWPTPDQGLSWWSRPGLMNWNASPPSTNVENLVDGINWESSGHSQLNHFYVIVRASQLTTAALRDHVHADIGMGVPTVIAARTSDGTNALPYWNVKPTRSAVNHFVTVVGYDDTAGTYAVMDTCGTTCNDRNVRAGVRNISQAALFSLIGAEVDDDGIMW